MSERPVRRARESKDDLDAANTMLMLLASDESGGSWSDDGEDDKLCRQDSDEVNKLMDTSRPQSQSSHRGSSGSIARFVHGMLTGDKAKRPARRLSENDAEYQPSVLAPRGCKRERSAPGMGVLQASDRQHTPGVLVAEVEDGAAGEDAGAPGQLKRGCSDASAEGVRACTRGPCGNCGTTETAMWRRDRDANRTLCNACGIYFKTHGVDRPPSGFGRKVSAFRNAAGGRGSGTGASKRKIPPPARAPAIGTRRTAGTPPAGDIERVSTMLSSYLSQNGASHSRSGSDGVTDVSLAGLMPTSVHQAQLQPDLFTPPNMSALSNCVTNAPPSSAPAVYSNASTLLSLFQLQQQQMQCARVPMLDSLGLTMQEGSGSTRIAKGKDGRLYIVTPLPMPT